MKAPALENYLGSKPWTNEYQEQGMCHGSLQRGHNPHNVILIPGMGWGHYFLLGDPELSLSPL